MNENRETLEKRVLFIFNKRGGKVVRAAEGLGKGFLGMYALQNTTKGRVSILAYDSDYLIEQIYIGDESGFPNVIRSKTSGDLGYINNYILDEEHLDVNKLIKAVDSER